MSITTVLGADVRRGDTLYLLTLDGGHVPATVTGHPTPSPVPVAEGLPSIPARVVLVDAGSGCPVEVTLLDRVDYRVSRPERAQLALPPARATDDEEESRG